MPRSDHRTSPLYVISVGVLSNPSLPGLLWKRASAVIKETSAPSQKSGGGGGGFPLQLRHGGGSRADVSRSPTMQMHARRWRGSQAIIITDMQHLRTPLIMVYMDFEALIKNSRPLRVYCVCTNCGDGACQECPPHPHVHTHTHTHT